MEETSRGPLPIRHSFLHEKGIFHISWMTGALIFLVLSGLAIWLFQFSVTTQVSVLLHTALGIALFIPFTLWQLSHWWASRKAPRSFRKFSAYAGAWTMIVATASGFVLTWQAFFGFFISHFWDRVHLWSGIAAIPFLAYHLYPKARKAVAEGASENGGKKPANGQAGLPLPDFRPGRRHLWAMASATAGLLIVATGVLAGIYSAYAPDFSHYKLPDDYKMPYGPNPFAPSMAMTARGGPVAPELLAGSKSCGKAGCHSAIYQEWLANSHRWSSEDVFFQGVQAAMIQQEGAPSTRYCAGCHDPVSLLSGYKNASTSIEAPGFKEGSSCLVCHAMRRVDVQGNGNYVWAPPKPYLFEYRESGYATAITRFLIRAYPQQHDLDYDLALSKDPASCGACHKQFIDKEINHVGWVQLQNQYDDWKHGKWNTDPNPAHRLRCQQCHMYYRAVAAVGDADPYDMKAGLGLQHRNHWFAAANQVMPEMIHSPDAAGQTERVNRWLQGKEHIPEIASVWPQGPVLPVKVVAPPSMAPGQLAAFRAVVSNNKAGHSFPTGPLDLIRAWVEVRVEDRTGQVVFHSGELSPDGYDEPGTFVLKAVGINPEGVEIVRHDLWHYVGAKWKRAIFPGYSDMYEYKFAVPRKVQGPLVITARLRYRKANQYFMDFAFPGKHLQTPITDIPSDQVEVPVSVAARGPKGETASSTKTASGSRRIGSQPRGAGQ